MLGLIPPNSGKIFRKNNLSIGYLPQKINYDQILPLSVSRIMKLTGIYKEKYILNTLDETGVSHLSNKPISYLSGGEFQRVMLAKALLKNPNLLVLDEPVKEGDYIGQSELYKLVADLT